MLLHLLGIVSLAHPDGGSHNAEHRIRARRSRTSKARVGRKGADHLITLCCPIGDYQYVATTESPLPAPGAVFDLSGHNIRDVDTDMQGVGGLLKSC